MELLISIIVVAIVVSGVIVISVGIVGFAGAFFSGMSKFFNTKLKQSTAI